MWIWPDKIWWLSRHTVENRGGGLEAEGYVFVDFPLNAVRWAREHILLVSSFGSCMLCQRTLRLYVHNIRMCFPIFIRFGNNITSHSHLPSHLGARAASRAQSQRPLGYCIVLLSFDGRTDRDLFGWPKTRYPTYMMNEPQGRKRADATLKAPFSLTWKSNSYLNHAQLMSSIHNSKIYILFSIFTIHKPSQS